MARLNTVHRLYVNRHSQDSNPRLLDGKQECFLCATQPALLDQVGFLFPGEQVGQPRPRNRRSLHHPPKSGIMVGDERHHRGLVRRDGRTGEHCSSLAL